MPAGGPGLTARLEDLLRGSLLAYPGAGVQPPRARWRAMRGTGLILLRGLGGRHHLCRRAPCRQPAPPSLSQLLSPPVPR